MNKNFKKTLVLLLMIFVGIFFVFENTLVSAISSSEKDYCTATVEDEFDDNEIIITLKNEESLKCKNYYVDDFSFIGCQSIVDLSEGYNEKIIKQLNNEYVKCPINLETFNRIIKIELNVHSKENVIYCIKLLEEESYVKSASPNYEIELEYDSIQSTSIINDPDYPDQEALDNLSIEYVWEDFTSGSENIYVGIIDTGIDINNPDLMNKVDSSLSISFDDDQPNPLVDEFNHGTCVAGIIGAAHNNFGIAGLCKNVTLVSLKIPSESSTHALNIAAAVEYAGANGIDVLNVSWACGSNNTLKEAIENYPGLVICAAGNFNKNMGLFNKKYPACYNKTLNNVISVGAVDFQNNRWIKTTDEGSNYSNDGYVDIFTYGNSILTTGSLHDNGDSIVTFTGTSAAAPHVTACVALLLSGHPCLSTTVVKNSIIDGSIFLPSADDLGDCKLILDIYGAFLETHLADFNYTMYNSDYHIAVCSVCNINFLEQHNWVLQAIPNSRYIINQYYWICSKCGTNQI